MARHTHCPSARCLVGAALGIRPRPLPGKCVDGVFTNQSRPTDAGSTLGTRRRANLCLCRSHGFFLARVDSAAPPGLNYHTACAGGHQSYIMRTISTQNVAAMRARLRGSAPAEQLATGRESAGKRHLLHLSAREAAGQHPGTEARALMCTHRDWATPSVRRANAQRTGTLAKKPRHFGLYPRVMRSAAHTPWKPVQGAHLSASHRATGGSSRPAEIPQ